MSNVKSIYAKQIGWMIGEVSTNESSNGTTKSFTIEKPFLITEQGFLPMLYFVDEESIVLSIEDVLGGLFTPKSDLLKAYKELTSTIVIPDKKIQFN